MIYLHLVSVFLFSECWVVFCHLPCYVSVFNDGVQDMIMFKFWVYPFSFPHAPAHHHVQVGIYVITVLLESQ